MSGYDLKHALQVASRVEGAEAKLVALLHDAVEDGACTFNDLAEADLSPEVYNALSLLTRRSQTDETYDDYIERIASSGDELAAYVKLADVETNLDRMDDEHASLSGRYQKARRVLREIT